MVFQQKYAIVYLFSCKSHLVTKHMYMTNLSDFSTSESPMDIKEYYRLHVAVEQIR